jgi:hypothetical protein
VQWLTAVVIVTDMGVDMATMPVRRCDIGAMLQCIMAGAMGMHMAANMVVAITEATAVAAGARAADAVVVAATHTGIRTVIITTKTAMARATMAAPITTRAAIARGVDAGAVEDMAVVETAGKMWV